jgi:hypothetical protein
MSTWKHVSGRVDVLGVLLHIREGEGGAPPPSVRTEGLSDHSNWVDGLLHYASVD